jgi:zinc and cadmium transporter
MLIWIIGFSLLGSVGSIASAALFLHFPQSIRKVLIPGLISYATGTMRGTAFLCMIPAGQAQAPANTISATVLGCRALYPCNFSLQFHLHCRSRPDFGTSSARRIRCFAAPNLAAAGWNWHNRYFYFEH